MSSSSGNRLPSASKGGAGSVSTPASQENTWGSGAPGRRRSSGGSDAGRFSGLMNQKRNSGDATSAARKASFNEQKPAPGFIGQMWNNFMKGGASTAGGAAGAYGTK